MFELIDNFLPAIEVAVAQKDIKAFHGIVLYKIDVYLQSVIKPPRDALDTVYNFNARILKGSRLSHDLQHSTVTYLNQLKIDRLMLFDKAINEISTAINNYKAVVRSMDNDKENRERLFVEQASIIAENMNDLIFELSRELKQIQTEFISALYTISVDTLTNGATNWRKTNNGAMLWLQPDDARQNSSPFSMNITSNGSFSPTGYRNEELMQTPPMWPQMPSMPPKTAGSVEFYPGPTSSLMLPRTPESGYGGSYPSLVSTMSTTLQPPLVSNDQSEVGPR